MLLRNERIFGAWSDLRDELVALCGDCHQRRDFVCEAAHVERLLGNDIGIEYWPALRPERFHALLDVGDGLPAYFAAGGRKFLDSVPERHGLGTNGAVLHIDDEEPRSAAKSRRLAKPRRAIGPLLL